MAATASPTRRGRLFSALSALADEIQEEKTAAAPGHEKAGAPTPPDPGGYQGASTHPTADVDNSAQTATEGDRSSENTADVKADQKAPAVDSTSEATPNQDEQDSVQLNIGTQQSATGEDSSVEDDYKGEKDDPGTSHPAQTEDGEKYGSLSFKEARSKFTSVANEVLADLANGFGTQLVPAKQAESSDPKSRPETSAPMTPVGGSAEGEHVQPGGGGKSKEKKKPKEATAETPATALSESLQKAADAVSAGSTAEESSENPMQAGYELAATLGLSKEAATSGVKETIAQTIRDAETDAELFGSFFSAFLSRQQKAAAVPPDEEGGEVHADPNDASSGANEAGGGAAPPAAAGGEPVGGAPPDLGALLGGGGEMGGEMGGGMGGLEGGEPSEEEALAELAAALEELGIPIEALVEAAGAAGGPAGGAPMGGAPMGGAPMGGAPMGGAPMGGEAAPPPPLMGGGMEAMASANREKQGTDRAAYLTKIATAVQKFKLSGKYQIKEAGERRQRQLRDVMKKHVRELLGL